MPLRVDLDPRKHYLRANVSGAYTLRDAQHAYDHIVRAAVDHGRERILIDATAVSGAPTQDERYMLGLFAAAQHHVLAAKAPGFSVQVAVLGRPPFVDPQRVGETVAVNRGAKVKVSERLDEALAWLGVSAGC